jgi:hypothetical protein
MVHAAFDLIPFRETPYNLQFIFAGKMFQWQVEQSFVAGITNMQIKTSTGTQIIHFVNRTIQTASTSLYFTFSELGIKANGTTFGVIANVNRDSTHSQTASILVNPTTSTGGATAPIILESVRFIADTEYNQISPELILKSNSNYLIAVNNTGLAASDANFSFVWYESNN